MEKIMGLDYGDRTIGVAISDFLKIIAQPIETIKRENPMDLKSSLERLKVLINDNNIKKVILGFPKNMNNSVGERGEKTLYFKNKLEELFNIEVVLWDERLTTIQAERVLIEGKVRRENRKKYIDKTAAAIILQSYLETLK